MKLREYITARRKALGLTQSQIGDALGYSETGMSKIESGDSLPPISILPALADRLGLSLNDLLLMKEKPEPFSGTNPPYDWRIVSANIRAVRLGHHLKQREAAEKIGVDKRTLITYEKGDACPNWDTLSRILPFCPGDPAGLFYGTLYPEIQASPLFRKRGTLPFFVFLFGVLFGAGVLGSILAPLAFAPKSGSSSSSINGSFGNGSSSSLPISSSSDDSSSGSSSDSSSSSALPIDSLTDLVVVGPDGTAMDAPMKIPTESEPTVTLHVGLYTGTSFTWTMRHAINFLFALDGYEPTGVTIANNGDSATVTAVYDAQNPIPAGSLFAITVKAWSPRDIHTVVEGIPLNVTMTQNGSF